LDDARCALRDLPDPGAVRRAGPAVIDAHGAAAAAELTGRWAFGNAGRSNMEASIRHDGQIVKREVSAGNVIPAISK